MIGLRAPTDAIQELVSTTTDDMPDTMDPKNKKADTALPDGSSHWDRLPNELKCMMFEFSSPLTLFVDGMPELKPKVDKEKIHSLWTEAFDIDWPGDLSLLPDPPSYSQLGNYEVVRVKSPSMYERLCQRFPKAIETNTEFSKVDSDTETHVQSRATPIAKYNFPFSKSPLRLLHIPMRHMWLDLLGDTLDEFPYARANDCITEGHTDLFRHLAYTGKIDLRHMLHVHRQLGERFYYNRPLDVAAGNGRLEIAKILHETGCHKATTNAGDWAARNGHLDVLKWLRQPRWIGCTNKAMECAAENGHLAVVKWMNENLSVSVTREAIDAAAFNGHLEIVKYLHEYRDEGCTTCAMDGAASHGHLNTVKWLHKNRSEGCTFRAMDYAAKNGHLEVVKWLHENRSEGCTKNAVICAERYNHPDVLDYLRTNKPNGYDVARRVGDMEDDIDIDDI